MNGQLKTRAVLGVKWTTIATIVVSGCDFLRVAILAHLLSPVDFGLIGMLMVIGGFAQAFADMGISNAIIQKQDATHNQLSSLYWANLFTGILVGGIVYLSAPLVAGFYQEPRLTQLMPWVSLSFFILPLGQQFQVLLQKELRFKTLTKIDISSAVMGTLVSIFAAVKGGGVYSLIFGSLANLIIRTGMLIVIGWKEWKPTFYFRFSDLSGYLRFGLYQMGERSVNYLSANVDYLFVGKFLGAGTLGIYTLAYQLVVMPFMKINPVLTRVAFPVFSKKQTDDLALRRGYVEMLKLISLLVSPVLIGIVATVSVFEPIVYGRGWEMTIPLVQILAIMSILKTLGNPSGSILLAKGRADIGFKWNVITAVLNSLVFLFVVQHGVFVLAWSWNILSIGYFIIGGLILFRVIGLTWEEYIYSFLQVWLISFIMGAFVYVSGMVMKCYMVNQLSILVLQVILGTIIYCALIFKSEKDYLLRLWALLFSSQREGGV